MPKASLLNRAEGKVASVIHRSVIRGKQESPCKVSVYLSKGIILFVIFLSLNWAAGYLLQ